MSQALFTKRTSSIYHSQVKRFREKRNKAGKVIRVERTIPYSLDEFRKWVAAQFDSQQFIPCAYCSLNITLATFCVDHDVPTGRGGSLALANLALCCERCNCTKGGLTGQEFRQFMKGLATFPEAARVDILRRLKMGGAHMGFLKRPEKEARNG